VESSPTRCCVAYNPLLDGDPKPIYPGMVWIIQLAGDSRPSCLALASHVQSLFEGWVMNAVLVPRATCHGTHT